jgi:hypothetical protein
MKPDHSERISRVIAPFSINPVMKRDLTEGLAPVRVHHDDEISGITADAQLFDQVFGNRPLLYHTDGIGIGRFTLLTVLLDVLLTLFQIPAHLLQSVHPPIDTH